MDYLAKARQGETVIVPMAYLLNSDTDLPPLFYSMADLQAWCTTFNLQSQHNTVNNTIKIWPL